VRHPAEQHRHVANGGIEQQRAEQNEQRVDGERARLMDEQHACAASMRHGGDVNRVAASIA
jgi:hypothetical protein